MSALTCCHPVVILSVERRTWVGGVPTYVGWNPTHPGPSLDARDDKSAELGTEDSALGPHPSALCLALGPTTLRCGRARHRLRRSDLPRRGCGRRCRRWEPGSRFPSSSLRG